MSAESTKGSKGVFDYPSVLDKVLQFTSQNTDQKQNDPVKYYEALLTLLRDDKTEALEKCPIPKGSSGEDEYVKKHRTWRNRRQRETVNELERASNEMRWLISPIRPHTDQDLHSDQLKILLFEFNKLLNGLRRAKEYTLSDLCTYLESLVDRFETGTASAGSKTEARYKFRIKYGNNDCQIEEYLAGGEEEDLRNRLVKIKNVYDENQKEKARGGAISKRAKITTGECDIGFPGPVS